MENILYEYHLSIFAYAENLIPLIVGCGFLFFSINLTSEKRRRRKNNEKPLDIGELFFQKIGFIVGPVLSVLSIVMILSMLTTDMEYRKMLNSNDVQVVEGYP